MVIRIRYKTFLYDFQSHSISIFFLIHRHEKEKIHINDKYINDKPIDDKHTSDDFWCINDNNNKVKQEKKLL